MSEQNDPKAADAHLNAPPLSGGPVKDTVKGVTADAAERAEGNKRVSVREAVEDQKRAATIDVDTPDADPSLDSEEEMMAAQELKRQAAAEDHQRVAADRGKGLHGRL